ncbi:MAG: class I SAM-dependent methyltransferase, partial [Nitrospirae bacterium]|nr:class I SAM-dependent methyltransferase [Nitrospirota bacterium]
LPHDGNVQILDLGCGPGSLAFHALQHYPNAYILAVDANSVLLAIGQQIPKKTTERLQFLEADIRQPDWWMAYKDTFDLVLSATTLHWLSPEHLTQVYQNIYQVLKLGGWFLSSDHIASDNSETQAHYRQMLQKHQQTAFRETGADDWDGFWQSLATELGKPDSQTLRGERNIWEGNDDGQPRQFHINTLQQCGFEKIEFYWQDLGEAVIGARKPLAG